MHGALRPDQGSGETAREAGRQHGVGLQQAVVVPRIRAPQRERGIGRRRLRASPSRAGGPRARRRRLPAPLSRPARRPRAAARRPRRPRATWARGARPLEHGGRIEVGREQAARCARAAARARGRAFALEELAPLERALGGACQVARSSRSSSAKRRSSAKKTSTSAGLLRGRRLDRRREQRAVAGLVEDLLPVLAEAVVRGRSEQPARAGGGPPSGAGRRGRRGGPREADERRRKRGRPASRGRLRPASAPPRSSRRAPPPRPGPSASRVSSSETGCPSAARSDRSRAHPRLARALLEALGVSQGEGGKVGEGFEQLPSARQAPAGVARPDAEHALDSRPTSASARRRAAEALVGGMWHGSHHLGVVVREGGTPARDRAPREAVGRRRTRSRSARPAGRTRRRSAARRGPRRAGSSEGLGVEQPGELVDEALQDGVELELARPPPGRPAAGRSARRAAAAFSSSSPRHVDRRARARARRPPPARRLPSTRGSARSRSKAQHADHLVVRRRSGWRALRRSSAAPAGLRSPASGSRTRAPSVRVGQRPTLSALGVRPGSRPAGARASSPIGSSSSRAPL